MEIWKRLPNGVADLNDLASAAARYNVDLVRGLALQKLACLLTSPNRWRWSWDAWKYSQSLQQLFPVWRAGFLREFRFSFDESLTPKQIHEKMSHIRDNIFEELGFRATYVLAKHRKKKKEKEGENWQFEEPEQKGTEDRKNDFTPWHVHGFLWPWHGSEQKPWKFTKQYARVQEAIKGNLWVTETYWRSPKDLPRAAAYLAFNYYRGTRYRQMLRERHKPSHEHLPQDAAEDVRLYSVPKIIWLAPKNDNQPQCRHDYKCERPRKRRDNAEYVPWNSLRTTGRLTPFCTAYRAAAARMADIHGLREERTEDKFDKHARKLIFERACHTVQDLPRVPTIVGYDGFVYRVVAGNALWFETPFYLLVRQEVPEDYTQLPEDKANPNRRTVPEKLDEIAFPISLFDLHKLAQAELSAHVPRAEFRPVSPVTGKLPRPMCFAINIPRQVDQAAEADGILENLWMRRAKKKKLTTSDRSFSAQPRGRPRV